MLFFSVGRFNIPDRGSIGLAAGGRSLEVAGFALGPAVFGLMASVAIGGNLSDLVGDYP